VCHQLTFKDILYPISFPGTLSKLAISKVQILNNVPFLCTKLFQKRGHYSRGDNIPGRKLFIEIRYLNLTKFDFPIEILL
jgi:hypothetical protein